MNNLNNLSIEEIEQYIKDGEMLKVRMEERLSTLTNQYKEKAIELSKLGVNPETALADIQKKEEEYNQGLLLLQNSLPIDIIDKYKGYDFSTSGNSVDTNNNSPF